MQFVHSVFTFRRPSETAKLNEAMQRLEFRPGLATSGEPVGDGYLDHFAVGSEVSVSLNSPTGKAARVNETLFVAILEAAGETANVSSSVLTDHEQTTWENPVINPIFTRIQQFGRINRVSDEALSEGSVVSLTTSAFAAKLASAAKSINNFPVVIADEATIADVTWVDTTPKQFGPKP